MSTLLVIVLFLFSIVLILGTAYYFQKVRRIGARERVREKPKNEAEDSEEDEEDRGAGTAKPPEPEPKTTWRSRAGTVATVTWKVPKSVWASPGKILAVLCIILVGCMLIVFIVGMWNAVINPDHHEKPMAYASTNSRKLDEQSKKEFPIYDYKDVVIPNADPGKSWDIEVASVSDVCIIKGKKKLSDGTFKEVGPVRFDAHGSTMPLPDASEYTIRLESGKESSITWRQY